MPPEQSVIDGGYSVGVDIGGTFTDCAVIGADGSYWTGKVPTTPPDLAEGFFNAIEAAAGAMGLSLAQLLSSCSRLAHGTTAGINALVTRSGARVGLLATAGHGDALRIMNNSGRVSGASLEEMLDYSISDVPEQLVARGDVREVVERIDYAGRVIAELDEVQLRASVRELVAQGVSAFAIAFLWSHVAPQHELRARAVVQEEAPDAFVVCGHEVAARVGEYPRTATAVMNAYIGPLMSRYLDSLVERAAQLGYVGDMVFATCEGGLTDLATVKSQPLLTAQSGPVGGALASAVLGAHMGFDNIIATDMGGTSLDASLVEAGDIQLTDETVIERHQVFLRKVAVESIGTGGGSIAWFDEAKQTLRVGPRSAGALPGPVCYGRGGTEVTVTDADLVLGLLSENSPLASGLALDRDAAYTALARLGERIGLGPVECAAGIVEIADSQMEDLLRRMTLQQGRDPREFVSWAFGGAAGLHGGLYSAGLGVAEVVVPLAELASVWSAYGIAAADMSRTFQHPLHLTTPLNPAAILNTFASLESDADAYRQMIGLTPERVIVQRTLEMKYAMQWYSVEVDLGQDELDSTSIEGIVERFESVYERRYGPGSGYSDGGVVLTAARVTMTAPADVPRPPSRELEVVSVPVNRTRSIYWLERGEFLDSAVVSGPSLQPGHEVSGPAVIEYPVTTVAVRPGQELRVDTFGNLVVALDRGPQPSSRATVGAEA